MSPRLAFALNCAFAAGRSTLSLFQNLDQFEQKEDQSPLTEADRRAESLIRSQIEAAYLGESIYGEEEGLTGDSLDRWVVDPIDGTKSFVAGVPLYATLLSYEVEGIPQLGVAYFPALEWMVYAELGGGAYANGRPIRVSVETHLSRCILCVGGHRSMRLKGRTAGFERLAQSAMATRTWGDAYGHCLVACGRVQAMVDPVVMPYDVSAVSLIVSEAGGRVTDFEGVEHPHYEAISSNGWLHDQILEAFSS